MSQISELPTTVAKKKVKIPNPYMLFVKERKMDIVQQNPEQNEVIGAYLGKVWRSMGAEEKKVYFDKYDDMKKKERIKLGELELTDEALPSRSRNEFTPVTEITTFNSLPLKMRHKGFKDLTMDTPSAILHEEHTDTKESDHGPGIDGSVSKKNSKMTTKSKKSRRSPNAFLLFASEQRKKLTIPPPTDEGNKQRHANKVLGMMWNDLPECDKEKYFLKARRLSKLRKDCPDLCIESSRKDKKNKSLSKKKGNKKKLPKKLKQMPTMQKVLRSSISTSIQKSDDDHFNITNPQKQEAADDAERINKKIQPTTECFERNSSVSYTSFQPLVSSSFSFDSASNPSTTTHPTTSTFPTASVSSFPASVTYPDTSIVPYSSPSFSSLLQPPCRCRHSSGLWISNGDLIPHQSNFGMDLPYFGTGFSQSLLPYQMVDSFWMHRQSFLQRPYNFFGHPCSSLYSHCSASHPQYFSPYMNSCAWERHDMCNPIIDPSPPVPMKPTRSAVANGAKDSEDDCSDGSRTLIIDENEGPN